MRAFRKDKNFWTYRALSKVYRELATAGIPLKGTLAELMTVNELTHYLIENELVYASGLAEATGLSKSAITRYTAQWLECGWIVERVDPDDRRRKLIGLSPRGIAISLDFTAALAAIFKSDGKQPPL